MSGLNSCRLEELELRFRQEYGRRMTPGERAFLLLAGTLDSRDPHYEIKIAELSKALVPTKLKLRLTA